jgi:YihY family inner membrane protein
MRGFCEWPRSSVLGRFYAKWSADLALNGVVLIAWQAQFSLVPLLLGLLGVLGLLLRDPAKRLTLVTAVVAQFPDQVGDLLGFMEETRQLGGLLGLASVVGLAWSGYWLFQTMALVFNQFYDAPERPLLGQVRMAATMVAIYAVLMPVSVLASGIPTFLAVISDRVLPFDVPGVAVVSGWLVSLGSATLMFLALYWIVPNRRLTLAQVWPGAALAGVLFVLLGQAFPLYLRLFGGGLHRIQDARPVTAADDLDLLPRVRHGPRYRAERLPLPVRCLPRRHRRGAAGGRHRPASAEALAIAGAALTARRARSSILVVALLTAAALSSVMARRSASTVAFARADVRDERAVGGLDKPMGIL